MQRQKKMLVLGLLLLFTLAVYARDDCRSRISLTATPDGAAIDASGRAEVRAQGDRQRLQVRIEADVDDGATFTVFANDRLVATLTIARGEAELELDTHEGGTLPPGIHSVCNLSTLDVVDDNGVVILHGDF